MIVDQLNAELEEGVQSKASAGEMLDSSIRDERVIRNMRDGKQDFTKSLGQLENIMRQPLSGRSISPPVRRRTSNFMVSDSARAGARRLSEFQQNVGCSQSDDLHARLCAENILRDTETAPEVNPETVSVRQLLTVDDRFAGMNLNAKRFEKKEKPVLDKKVEFTVGMKKRNITSWRSRVTA